MAARRGRRLGRALVFAGVVLLIPELWFVWTLLYALFTPIRAPSGQLAQVHVNLNGSAWAALVGWTAACLALIGWGVRIIRKGGSSANPTV